MFVRNYSQIVRYLDARTPLDLANHHFQDDDDASQPSRSGPFEQSPCANGWTYDRRTFPNTVVMEVNWYTHFDQTAITEVLTQTD